MDLTSKGLLLMLWMPVFCHSRLLRYNIQRETEDSGGKPTISHPLCPNRPMRPTPKVILLKSQLEFEKKDCGNNLAPDVTSKCEKNICQKSIQFGQKENGTMSILLKPLCQEGLRMRCFQFGEISMDIDCKSEEEAILYVQSNGLTFQYGLDAISDAIHFLLKITFQENTRGATEEYSAIPMMYVNGKVIHPSKIAVRSYGKINGAPMRYIIFGYQNLPENTHGHSDRYIGSILAADYIIGHLANRALEDEVQYMYLLTKDAPHPQCLCKSSCGELNDTYHCSDGNGRLLDFMGVVPQYKGDYYKEKLTIYLLQTAMVKKIEIRASEVPSMLDIYKVTVGGNGILKISHTDEWVKEDELYKFIWKPKNGLVCNKLVMTLNRNPKQDHLRGILLYGRYVGADEDDEDESPEDDACECFPGNSLGCDKSQCICRENATYNCSCSPYITKMWPTFGPKSGGINITLSGGLLMPKWSKPKMAQIMCEEKDFCSKIHLNDTNVICTVVGLDTDASNNDGIVKLMIIVENVPYEVENSELRFTYKPDPKIEDKQVIFWQDTSELEVILQMENYISVDWDSANKCTELYFLEKNLTLSACNMSEQRLLCHLYNVSIDEGSNVRVVFRFDECNISTTTEVIYKTRFGVNDPSTSVSNVVTEDSIFGSPFEEKRADLIIGVAITLTILLVVGFLALAIGIYLRRKIGLCHKGRTQSPESEELLTFLGNVYYYAALHCTDRVLNNLFVDFADINLGLELTRGTSGTVLRGTLTRDGRSRSITLKTLNDYRKVDNAQLGEFLEEATILKKFEHENVLSLIGIVVEEWNLYVVLPFMENGDLHSYIIRSDFNVANFAQLGLDVARGMAYLSDQGFVHRDLAARNCQVNAQGHAVIADFGLASDLFRDDYHQNSKKKLQPFRWMAIESLESRIFTSESDVWSFGVVLWEIFSKGARPYAGVENSFIREYLKRGGRLGIPASCPNYMYQLMKKCWDKKPKQRPNFRYFVDEIEVFLFKYSGTAASLQSINATEDQGACGFSEDIPSILG